jgi:hypothetical protein
MELSGGLQGVPNQRGAQVCILTQASNGSENGLFVGGIDNQRALMPAQEPSQVAIRGSMGQYRTSADEVLDGLRREDRTVLFFGQASLKAMSEDYDICLTETA